jgi:hypothetical protein
VPIVEFRSLLDQLAEDRATLVNLPELHRLQTSLVAAGLGEFLVAMRDRQVSAEYVVASFR